MSLVAPYLTLLPEDARQRKHDLREVFNALGWMVRAGAARRLMPTNFPPWEALCQQTQRRLKAGSFEMMVHDRRALLRLAEGRTPEPWAVVLDGPTLQSTPESGGRAGYDGYKRKKGSKLPMVVDTLGNLLALLVTPANEQERAQVEALAKAVQEVTGERVEVGFVDQGYEGVETEAAAEEAGIRL
jgi:transposase